ncbi:hypothetical protein FA15DRAFT_626455 [Coprinopsis marcescibilis]|uniref:Uncharacterized protein n=1 Tax=Coprinopsis marcescibilis TaxID=230819 RepID=A0A5C3KHK6_COPMA|nr:hypothetical protein FA15DRAFT_626455 [Coprinopsis marcescibilis]
MASNVSKLEDEQDLFRSDLDRVPDPLKRAVLRMDFSPSYVIVGVYRLFTDKNLWKPAWDKCRHGVARGAAVGAIWAFLTFGIQKKFIEFFLTNSPRVTGLSNDTVFGYKIPFNLHTYAAILYMGHQLTFILKFFLSKNIRIARDRVWDQAVQSRGKGPDFWRPYVEEWDNPPVGKAAPGFSKNILGGKVGWFMLKRTLLIPTHLYPVVGVLVSASFRALGTAQYLHTRYFKAKGMSEQQTAVFIEERKWDYRAFGFAAALLEGLPIIGLVFTISNRIGAAMWAFDLEKRQHFVAAERERERNKRM